MICLLAAVHGIKTSFAAQPWFSGSVGALISGEGCIHGKKNDS
jgi:hypothetical protein